MNEPSPANEPPDESGDPPEGSLVDRAQSGSDEALGKLINECRDYLLLVANREFDRELHAKCAPSDLVQETLIRAHERFDQFRGENERDFLAWVRRILLNHLVNVRRDLHRDKRDVNREQPMAGNSNIRLPAIDPATGDPTPSRQISNMETAKSVLSALKRLPKDYRKAVIMRTWNKSSFGEIGKALDRSEEAARKLFNRAVIKLQQELDDIRDQSR